MLPSHAELRQRLPLCEEGKEKERNKHQHAATERKRQTKQLSSRWPTGWQRINSVCCCALTSARIPACARRYVCLCAWGAVLRVQGNSHEWGTLLACSPRALAVGRNAMWQTTWFTHITHTPSRHHTRLPCNLFRTNSNQHRPTETRPATQQQQTPLAHDRRHDTPNPNSNRPTAPQQNNQTKQPRKKRTKPLSRFRSVSTHLHAENSFHSFSKSTL